MMPTRRLLQKGGRRTNSLAPLLACPTDTRKGRVGRDGSRGHVEHAAWKSPSTAPRAPQSPIPKQREKGIIAYSKCKRTEFA